MKIFSPERPITLSDVLPMLENMVCALFQNYRSRCSPPASAIKYGFMIF